MRTPANRKPPLAAWIQRERLSRKWKPKDIVDRLAAMNLEVSEATVKVWESNADRRPSPYNLEGLEAIFGSRAPMAQAGDMGDTPVPGLAAYLERIDALVATVDRLIAQHEADRAIIASLIGLPGGADAERWKSFREWQASNPLPHDPALTGR